jgi:hypothetical protein
MPPEYQMLKQLLRRKGEVSSGSSRDQNRHSTKALTLVSCSDKQSRSRYVGHAVFEVHEEATMARGSKVFKLADVPEGNASGYPEPYKRPQPQAAAKTSAERRAGRFPKTYKSVHKGGRRLASASQRIHESDKREREDHVGEQRRVEHGHLPLSVLHRPPSAFDAPTYTDGVVKSDTWQRLPGLFLG